MDNIDFVLSHLPKHMHVALVEPTEATVQTHLIGIAQNVCVKSITIDTEFLLGIISNISSILHPVASKRHTFEWC